MDDAVRDLDCRRVGGRDIAKLTGEGRLCDNRTSGAYSCHSMAISSLQRTWQLDPNSDLGLSGSWRPSVLNRQSASTTLNGPSAPRGRKGAAGKGMRAADHRGHGFKQETIANHGVKEWL